MEIHLIQVTEKLPPSLHGIGDYAYELACKLKNKYNINSSFIVFDIIPQKNNLIQEFPVYSLPESGLKLDEIIVEVCKKNFSQKNILLLHFNGGLYDAYVNKRIFDRFHLSLELLKVVKSSKTQTKYKLLMVIHELFYPKIERKRDYLLRPLQKVLIKKIVQITDILICNNPVYAKQIYKLYPKSQNFICPVFSNIGEPIQNPIKCKQEGAWVIFGSTETLIKTLKQFLHHINIIKNNQKINILNILGGQKNNIVMDLMYEARKYIANVNYYPSISNYEAKQIFEVSQFCYMYYFAHNLLSESALIFKSGVFATACSYGVIPVFGNPGMENAIGVLEHPGFVFFKDGQFNFPNNNKLNNLSIKLFDWYKTHSSIEHATDIFYKAIL